VKHYRGYLSCNSDFKLDVSRWVGCCCDYHGLLEMGEGGVKERG
jgi:hypothetical protein